MMLVFGGCAAETQELFIPHDRTSPHVRMYVGMREERRCLPMYVVYQRDTCSRVLSRE